MLKDANPGKASSQPTGLGTFSTLSIGIGGMVGGGIFAVTGLTVQVTKGGAAVAFLIAGIVALLTSYSYLKLTLRFEVSEDVSPQKVDETRIALRELGLDESGLEVVEDE